MQSAQVQILVFARAPIAGQVNTRLIPDIGEAAATRLQQELLEARLAQLTEAAIADVQLLCAPDSSLGYFQQCRQRYGIALQSQQGRDLGERMQRAAQESLAQYAGCLIIGTDAPSLTMADIRQAAQVLQQGGEVVFVPAEDGGYVLLGLSQSVYANAAPALFENIDWGSSQVMAQSRRALAEAGVAVTELETRWDIDRYEDYCRYQNP